MKNPHKTKEEKNSRFRARERSLTQSMRPPLCRLLSSCPHFLALTEAASDQQRSELTGWCVPGCWCPAGCCWGHIVICRRDNLQATVYSRSRLSMAQRGFGCWSPWMGTLLSPGQPGFPCLWVDADPHSPGGLPAGTAPTDHLKPTLFRNKGAICTTHGPMEPAWHGHGKSPGGKSTKAITKRVGRRAVPQGALGTGHSCSSGPWDQCLWHRDEERWGERHKCDSFPKCTFLQRLVQPDVSHLSHLARFSGLGCKNNRS